MRESLLIAFTATRVMMVEQLGFAIIPFLLLTASSALISGTTRGISGSIRNALELSIKVAPAATISSANCFATAFDAAPRTISKPAKAPSSASSIVSSLPLNDTFLPTLLSLAKSLRVFTGKSLSSRTFIISLPTAPLAPRIPTLYFFILNFLCKVRVSEVVKNTNSLLIILVIDTDHNIYLVSTL